MRICLVPLVALTGTVSVTGLRGRTLLDRSETVITSASQIESRRGAAST